MFVIYSSINCDKSHIAIETQRNYGIDCLRIVSMLYIVILHTLGHGGVLNSAKEGSVQYQLAWFLEIWSYCAVDVFALISGYVAVENTSIGKYYEKYVVLWIRVVFYSLLMVLACNILFPDLVTRQDLIRAFFPVTTSNYWYFTSYTGVVCLMPVVSTSLRYLNVNQAKKVMTVLIAVFSVYDIIAKQIVPLSGYNFSWLMILFILGAIIKKSRTYDTWRDSYLAIGILVLNSLTWIWKIYGISLSFFFVKIDNNLFVSYCSPTVLMSSIFYLVLFSRVPCRNRYIQKVITVCATGSFSVYLINDNPCFRKCFIKNRFADLTNDNVALMSVKVLLYASVFLFLALLIDSVRQKLFKVCKIRTISHYFYKKMDTLLGIIIKTYH